LLDRKSGGKIILCCAYFFGFYFSQYPVVSRLRQEIEAEWMIATESPPQAGDLKVALFIWSI